MSAASAAGFPFFQKVPVEYINPREHPHSDCPPDTHILGHGIGGSPQEARKGARADVVRQIRSSISSLSQRVSTAQQTGKHDVSSTTLSQTIIEESDFSYAEKITDIGKTYKKKKKYFALACLAKEETALYMYEQVKERISRLGSVLDISHRAYQKEDRISFTTEYTKTKNLYQNLASDIALIRVLHDVPAVVRIISKYNQFEKEADQLYSSFRLGISSNHPSTQAQLLSMTTELNINAFVSSNACHEDQTHHAFLVITPECKKKMGNHFCSVNISYSVRDCIQDKDFAQQLSNSIIGADSRSKLRAMERAYQQIQLQKFDSQIQESFRIFLPQRKE